MKIIFEKCDPEAAKDKTLPTNSFLVEYFDDELCYDIVVCSKKVEIFDHYWDKCRDGLKNITQTDGNVNPKLWGNTPPKKKGKP